VTVNARKPAANSTEVWTVARIIDWTTGYLKQHGSDTPRLDAEILLAHTRNCSRIQLYTRFDEVLTDEERTTMRELVRRRAQAEPVAYLVGHREFFGLDFQVTHDVLIPRPDTETLVVELLELARPLETPRILDLCTGSGCIAIAATVNLPAATLVATDISPAALAVARENAGRHQVTDRIAFLEGDLFAPVGETELFDFVVSNPPYIPTDDLDKLDADVRLHEPRGALDGGPDGLRFVRQVIEQAPRHLRPGGWILVEIDCTQPDLALDAVNAIPGYQNARIIKDLAGRPRVVLAQRGDETGE